MRPLNRPMFKYGGPIKEGIMNGMKERRMPFNQGGSYFSNLAAKTASLFSPFKKLKPVQKFLQKQKIQIPPARVQNTTGMGGVKLTEAQIKSGMGTTGVPFMTRVKQFASLNPKFTYGAAPFAVSGAVTAGPPVIGGGLNLGKKALLQATDLLVPDFIFDQDKFVENRKIAELNKNIQTNKKNTINENNKATTTTNKIDRDAEIEANRQRYYKILGIDNMKKDAAYKSLIDASKIVQEEGGDLKGALKSGTLQNRIIQAISKNLDKSSDIKRQIDAAIVKSEIDKDVNKDRYALDKLVKEKQLKVLDKQIEGGSLNEVLSDLQIKQGIVPQGPELAEIAIRKGVEIPSGHIFNSKDVSSFLKDNPTLTVVDFVNDQNLKLQQAGKGSLTPGNFVVGNNIVKVGEDGTVTDVLV
jgi:hypothetical protein